MASGSAAARKLLSVSRVKQPDDVQSVSSATVSGVSGSVVSMPSSLSGEQDGRSVAVDVMQSENVVPNAHEQRALQGIAPGDWMRLKCISKVGRQKSQTSACFDVSKFVIIKLQAFGKEKMPAMSVLLVSSRHCGIKISYKDNFLGNGYRSCISLDGQIVGDAVGDSISNSQCAAAQLVLNSLSSVCPTIIVRKCFKVESLKAATTPAQVLCIL